MRAQQKAGQHILGLEAAMAVQVQTCLDRFPLARHAAMTAGVQIRRRRLGPGRG
jgi:hypothetical protein